MTAKWKGFDLSLVFQGAAQRTIFRTGDNNGHEIWRIPMKALYLNTSNQSVGNTWSPENRGAYYPTYSNKNEINDYNYQASSWSVEDGSYIRLKNVELGYTLPQRITQKANIKQLRIYANLYNCLTFSSQKFFDPEQLESQYSFASYPQIMSFNVGINLKF